MSNDDKSKLIGPVFEPDAVLPSGGIGPALPVHLYNEKVENQSGRSELIEAVGTIGPLIPGLELQDEWRHLTSNVPDKKKEVAETKCKRDSWMTELLPSSNRIPDLKPRKFRQGLASDDVKEDSSWFSDPKQSNNKFEKTKEESMDNFKSQFSNERDKMMANIASKLQSDRKESLLEIHRKKLKKKSHKKEKKSKKDKKKSKKHKKKKDKSSSPEIPTRRPFNRETDLKITRIDSAARQSIIDRSKQISTRFGFGKQQFL